VFVGRLPGLGIVVNGFRPERYDLLGATLCLAGVAVLMDAPWASSGA
jgi:small multidrug resistance family-3 protein